MGPKNTERNRGDADGGIFRVHNFKQLRWIGKTIMIIDCAVFRYREYGPSFYLGSGVLEDICIRTLNIGRTLGRVLCGLSLTWVYREKGGLKNRACLAPNLELM